MTHVQYDEVGITTFRRTLYALQMKDWLWATAFAFTGYVGYYILLVLSIRLSDMAIAALIVGISPITVAIYGNIQQREFPFYRLYFPLTLITIGLVSLYWGRLSQNINETQNLILGAFFALIALLLWTWYAVQNAKYLKQKGQENVENSDWSIAIGICTLGITVLLLSILPLTGIWSPFAIVKVFETTQLAITYLGISLLLGIVVTYYATVLLNHLSRSLPVSLIGQLLVFETLSSILYKAIVDQTIPPIDEIISISVVLIGVTLGVRAIYKSL